MGCPYILRECFSDLAVVAKEGCLGARDPSGEESGEVGGDVVKFVGMVVSLDIDLSVWGKFIVWFLTVLVALYVKDV
jgi:hypothetical protein